MYNTTERTPCVTLKVNQFFRVASHRAIFRLMNKPGKKPLWLCCQPASRWCVSYLHYCLTLKKDAVCSSEMLIDLQWTTQKMLTLSNHSCENLKSNKLIKFGKMLFSKIFISTLPCC
jgi:hypothetical protein